MTKWISGFILNRRGLIINVAGHHYCRFFNNRNHKVFRAALLVGVWSGLFGVLVDIDHIFCGERCSHPLLFILALCVVIYCSAYLRRLYVGMVLGVNIIMIREKIVNLIKKSIREAQKEDKLPVFEIPDVLVEPRDDERYGDYTTNVAMQIAKIAKEEPTSSAEGDFVGRRPMEIAKLIISNFEFRISNFFDKVEVKEPGFINFFISKEFLQKQVKEILGQGEDFGKLKTSRNKKIHPVKSFAFSKRKSKILFNRVNIEFICGNPTGALHIGHGRGAFFGDCLANVLGKAGYKTIREYFVNDAKSSNQIRELGKTAIGKGNTYLTEKLKVQISRLQNTSQISKLNESEAGYLLAQVVQKDNKDFIEKKLKIKFDNWISEEDLYKKGKIKKVYEQLQKKDLVYEKEGAEWLKTTEFGDKQDWVLIRATAEPTSSAEGDFVGRRPTYLLSDITYHKDKFDRKFSKIINIWGADHQGHVSKIKAVAKILGYRGNLDILITQVVRLKGGLKLSKRKGQIIALEDLVDEVGLDAARFFYLTKSLNTQMEFDMELAKEQSEKNPVYYIQYAYARIHSILAKSRYAKIKEQKSKIQIKNQKLELLNHPGELALIKQLIRFPEVIEDTAKDYQVQRIPQYALDLATVFHQFYRDCRVLTEDKELSQARLALILATKIVLKNTLDLMGISSPEKM